MILQVVFWASVLLVAYPLILYPLLVALVGVVRARPVRRAALRVRVSVLIPAFNEEEVIEATIRNKLEQDYPRDLFEIIVVSDASSDRTDEIVRGFAGDGVRLLRNSERAGKAEGLNRAVREATGEILIFSDANSLFAPDAISRLVENFADPDVGYVTGALGFLSADGIAGGGVDAYIRYENFVRRIETRVHSIIGVNGGVDAIRRSLYRDVPKDQITDFVLPLSVLMAGRRVVFDNTARAREEANQELAPEFNMRVRVALRAMRGLCYVSDLLKPWRYPWAAFCIWSHKVLRYGAYLFMLAALASNAALAVHSGFYLAVLGLQLLFYAIAAATIALGSAPWLPRVLTLPAYILTSNTAFAIASVRFLRGESMATWRPRAG